MGLFVVSVGKNPMIFAYFLFFHTKHFFEKIPFRFRHFSLSIFVETQYLQGLSIFHLFFMLRSIVSRETPIPPLSRAAQIGMKEVATSPLPLL